MLNKITSHVPLSISRRYIFVSDFEVSDVSCNLTCSYRINAHTLLWFLLSFNTISINFVFQPIFENRLTGYKLYDNTIANCMMDTDIEEAGHQHSRGRNAKDLIGHVTTKSTTEIFNGKIPYSKPGGYCKLQKGNEQTNNWCSPSLVTNVVVIIFLITAGTIVVGIIVTYLVVPMISKKSIDTSDSNNKQHPKILDLSGKTTYLNGVSQQIRTPEVTVKSSLNLHEITESTTSIQIVKLTDSISFPPSVKNVQIRELKMVGPITRKWLFYLLETFTELETIFIDSDKVCEGFGKETKTLMTPIKVNNLHKLTVENSYNCPIMDWGFNVDMPNLKIIEVYNAILSGKHYDIFENILLKASNSLEGIDISKSYLCDDCDITEMEFENLRYLKITKRLDRDPRNIFAQNK